MRWLAGRTLQARLGRETAAAVVQRAEGAYVRPPSGRTATGRLNLEMGAYLLALRDGLNTSGYGETECNRLLADALFKVMRRFYRPLDALAFLLHPRNGLARTGLRQRFSRRVLFAPPDWAMEDVPNPSGYAFDVRRCLLADYMRSRGEEVFCQQVFCEQDLLMARGRGERFVRTMTIAGGGDRCDFRFPRG